MSKDYELLTQEAAEEEFENMANQTSERQKEEVRKTLKIKRIEEARPLKVNFGLPEANQVSDHDSDTALSKKGEFNQIVTLDTYDGLIEEEEAVLAANEQNMWSQVADQFGHPVKFLGNPFDKAVQLQKELLECVEQAQQVMENLGIKEEVNEIVAKTNSAENN